MRKNSAILDASQIAEKILSGYDSKKAITLALIHDDAEMITGDIQLGHKQIMTLVQLKKIEENEKRAIEKLSQVFPKIVNGYD